MAAEASAPTEATLESSPSSLAMAARSLPAASQPAVFSLVGHRRDSPCNVSTSSLWRFTVGAATPIAGDTGGPEIFQQGAVCGVGMLRDAPIGEQLVVIRVELQDARRPILHLADAASQIAIAGADARRHLGERRGPPTCSTPAVRQRGFF